MPTMMFVDTDIIVYTRDSRNPIKHRSAVRWIDHLAEIDRLVVGPQVLHETYRVLSQRVPGGSKAAARAAVEKLLPFARGVIDAKVTSKAMDLHERYRISWWDAIMVATAIDCGCRFFLTEDRGIDRGIEDIVIVDAFAPDAERVLQEL